MELNQVIDILKSQANPLNVAGMAKFGINPRNTLGVSVVQIRALAKMIKKDHALALELWDCDIHEARILAALIAQPSLVTQELMEKWAAAFDSWDICDQVCSNLFRKTPFAYAKAIEWALREEEFVRRAGFVMMCVLAVHDKARAHADFEEFFPLLMEKYVDERNFVKKAVNWALRQIGKRSRDLNAKAIVVAEEIKALNTKASRWIANDALRELTNEKIVARLKR